jgi:hypothetical protein
VVDQSPSPSCTEWLLEHCFHLEPADAARTVDLARLCGQPRNQVIAAAVAGGSVTVRKAMTALRQLGQVEHALEPGKREEALASLTQMAQSGYDRHVIAIGRTLISLVGAERALEGDETALRALSSLRLSPLANGMLRLSGQLDPEAGAVLTAALDPLSAPHQAGANGGRDSRPGDRRRAEALIELCRRAAAAGGAAPATTKAQIVVTIGHERLAGAVRGAGHTLDGRRRTHRPAEPRPAVRPPPHLGPPTRPDRHRHRLRRHLANLTAPDPHPAPMNSATRVSTRPARRDRRSRPRSRMSLMVAVLGSIVKVPATDPRRGATGTP